MSHENKSSVSEEVCSSKKEWTKYGLCLVSSYLKWLREKELGWIRANYSPIAKMSPGFLCQVPKNGNWLGENKLDYSEYSEKVFSNDWQTRINQIIAKRINLTWQDKKYQPAYYFE